MGGTEDSKPKSNTFHAAIKAFIRPPNQKVKPALPAFRRRTRRRETVKKPAFELNAEIFKDDVEKLAPKRFDGSLAGVITFKSPAVFCEVKLAEMLGKSPEPRDKPVTPGKYEFTPDGYRTSVCCQLLAEIGKMSTPFATVLATIHEELEQAIYSNYVTPSHTTVFEQVPYFELVSGVESKNAAMQAEQERWKVMLSEREGDIAKIEANMMELRGQIISERETVLELQRKLNQTSIALERRAREVAKLESQLEQSRAEVLHAQDVENMLGHEKNEYENLMAKHLLLITELQHCQINLEVARKEAAEGVPKKDVAVLRTKVKDLEQKLVKADILTQQMNSMTPRPHWALLRGGHHYIMSTAAQAAEVCKLNDLLLENVTTLRLECATAQVALAEAYSPLGSWGTNGVEVNLLEHPVLKGIGEKLGKSPAQVALRWGVQMGNSVQPKSMKTQRLKENSDIFNFSLSREDMAELEKLEQVRFVSGSAWIADSGSYYKMVEDTWDGEGL